MPGFLLHLAVLLCVLAVLFHERLELALLGLGLFPQLSGQLVVGVLESGDPALLLAYGGRVLLVSLLQYLEEDACVCVCV